MEKITKILLLIFFLVFTKNVNSKSPPPGTGTSDIPANIMIMLDNSGSMNWALNSSSASSLEYPIDVAVDSSGNIYALEYFRCRVVKYNSSGTFIRAFGSCGEGDNQLQTPYQITINGSEIFIANSGSDKIDVKDLDGNFKRRLSLGSSTNPNTRGIAVSGNYLYTNSSNQLRVYNKNLGKLSPVYTSISKLSLSRKNPGKTFKEVLMMASALKKKGKMPAGKTKSKR
jgi:hypothetical protein